MLSHCVLTQALGRLPDPEDEVIGRAPPPPKNGCAVGVPWPIKGNSWAFFLSFDSEAGRSLANPLSPLHFGTLLIILGDRWRPFGVLGRPFGGLWVPMDPQDEKSLKKTSQGGKGLIPFGYLLYQQTLLHIRS